MPAEHSRGARVPVPWRLAVPLALLAGAAVLATAWISDDALVTFRTVENFVAGDGLRWNVQDRAQTATHPLWVLLLAAGRLVTGELYFTAIGLGVSLSALAVLLLARAAPGPAAAIVFAGLAVLGSRSFVAFGTCGLENALTSALIAAFAHEWFRAPRRPARLGLWAGLIALARQDLVLLVLPCVVAALRGVPWRAGLRALLPGALPAAAWYLFALVYYGTVIPTPGYGKLVAADVSLAALGAQGLWYLADLGWRDPVTALALALALGAGLRTRRAGLLAPALGVLLQVLYTLRVGGDFMAGRFFTPAFVLALAAAAHGLHGGGRLAAAAAFAVAAAAGGPEWLRLQPDRSAHAIWHGIGDERAFYAQELGLWSAARLPVEHGVLWRMTFAGRERGAVLLAHAAGVPGYGNGRLAHVVDPYLCDPLLMRLPLADPAQWRIGHYRRRLPEGWLETLASGENRLRHPALARYWDALEVLLRAPVFSAARWRVWWGFRTGEYEPLLAAFVRDDYRAPPCVEVAAAELPAVVAPGTHWHDVRCVVVREGGVRFVFGARPARAVRLTIDGGGAGEVVWRRGGAELARSPFAWPGGLFGGARTVELAVPAAAEGCDGCELRPRPEAAAGGAALGTLEVLAVLAIEPLP